MRTARVSVSLREDPRRRGSAEATSRLGNDQLASDEVSQVLCWFRDGGCSVSTVYGQTVCLTLRQARELGLKR